VRGAADLQQDLAADEAFHGEGEEDSVPGERGGRSAAEPGGRRSTPWGR
jgi:hypothetical protein